ncbi:class I SAM-dependent methyltransferase [Gilvimarinus sp. 1_MG-2023]|uniref:class I SAM-dependent methyltransferase n=1 Tax=Gilvimarinus sp. 1_MG-2023 TaxID=3062638 RepID=UPI0026E3EEE2|nr:methyltransferase domain-containing protein [Gilvimarinus sp. 1_MG-2023]MDO6746394.1 methyltransferase domain-containing protein [Gilvimarinus sp. 1_MG-2023]
MIQVNPNTFIEGTTQCDEQKLAHITHLVKKDLTPTYKEFPQWVEFFDFLSSNQVFLTSDHYYRYLNTFGALLQELGEIKNKIIVETGCASPISLYLGRYNECYSTESDLRINLDIESEFADIVISLEVLEHIKDQPEKDIYDLELFHESGAKRYAQEIHRIIKKDGLLVLTTPNPCSYQAISNTLEYKAPSVFRGHVREYTKHEILSLFSNMHLFTYTTQFNFFMLGNKRNDWLKLFRQNHWDTSDRGDDHFLLFKK